MVGGKALYAANFKKGVKVCEELWWEERQVGFAHSVNLRTVCEELWWEERSCFKFGITLTAIVCGELWWEERF